MNSDKYVLQEVVTPALEREWLDLPKKIYKGNRNWVCPLDTDIRKVFDPARNEQFADGEAVRWVVRNRAGEVVGRIAAFYNREKASLEEQPTGGCGFFESIDDQQVADLMFDASRMWLASRGMEAMDGPINFGQRDAWWGLLVEGYEFQPLYENPYNPPEHLHLENLRRRRERHGPRPGQASLLDAGLRFPPDRHVAHRGGGRELPHHI